VCGGRDFTDRDFLYKKLDELQNWEGSFDIVITGGARGADTLAKEWAEERGIHCAEVKALWNKFGKRAGYERNAAMLALDPYLVVAFPGGIGTNMMVDLAEKQWVEVRDFR
jgi:hypothetical protein